MDKKAGETSKSPRSSTASRESSPMRTPGPSTSLANIPLIVISPPEETSLERAAESATTPGSNDESLDLLPSREVHVPAAHGVNLPSTSRGFQTLSVPPETRPKVSRKAGSFDTSAAKKRKVRRSPEQGSTGGSTVDPEIENIEASNELAPLNNRLASYIQRIKGLESQLRNSQRELEELRRNASSERDSQRALHEQEIGNLRSMLTEEARKSAQATSQVNSAVKNAERLEQTNAALKQGLSDAQERIRNLESENGRLNSGSFEASASQTQIRVELEGMQNQLTATENELQSAAFENVQLRQELQIRGNEVNRLRVKSEKDLAELNALRDRDNSRDRPGPSTDPEVSLQRKIEEFRQRYEVEAEEIRERFKEELRQRLAGLVPADDLIDLRNENGVLRLENNQLKLELEESKRSASHDLSMYYRMLANQRLELSSGQRKFDELKSEYDRLLENQTQHSNEVEFYRTLLRQEEARRHQNAPRRSNENSQRDAGAVAATASSSRQTVRFDAGRRVLVRNVYQYSHGLRIVSHDPVHGECIVLENLTNRDLDISTFELIISSGDSQIRCRFPQNTVVKARQQSRIWAARSRGGVHSPPQSYILDNVCFLTNEDLIGEVEAKTQIRNPAGVEIAVIISKVRGRREVNAIFNSRFNRQQPREDEANDEESRTCSFM